MPSMTLQLYRIENGDRVKYRFDVDETMTILKETRVGVEVLDSPRRMEGVTASTKDGHTVVSGVDSLTQMAMSFFTNNPCCTTQECIDLKKEIDEAVEAAGGSDCVGCSRGAIIRKYIPKIKEVLQNVTHQ